MKVFENFSTMFCGFDNASRIFETLFIIIFDIAKRLWVFIFSAKAVKNVSVWDAINYWRLSSLPQLGSFQWAFDILRLFYNRGMERICLRICKNNNRSSCDIIMQ